MLKYGCTNPRRRQYRDGIALAMRRTSSSSNPQLTIGTPKTILKYYQEVTLLHYFKPFHPWSTYVIRQHMSGGHLTQSEYALQQIVGIFWELLSQLAEARLTHIYRVVFHFCQLENIDYLVLRYLNTGAWPFKEWADEWLHDGEIWSSYTSETVCGEDSIYIGLGQVIHEGESLDKTRKTRVIR